MCLEQQSKIIEKACKEINKVLVKNRGIKYINGYRILKDEAEPVIYEITKQYNLNPELMFKRLDIR